MVLTPWAMREATVASAVVIASMRATWLRWCSGQLHRSWLCCRGRGGVLQCPLRRLLPAPQTASVMPRESGASSNHGRCEFIDRVASAVVIGSSTFTDEDHRYATPEDRDAPLPFS